MIRLALFALAVASATAAVMMYRAGTAPRPAQVETAAPTPTQPEVRVLVAQRALPERHRIEAGDIGWTDWPEDRVQPFFTSVPDPAEEFPPGEITGFYTPRSYGAGEPLDVSALARHRIERLSDRVSPGMRAVSLAVSDETTAGGFVQVDDFVDIIRVGPGTSAAGGPDSRVILENVRVLAVGSSMGDAPDTSPGNITGGNPDTVTVELTPRQANLLAGADYEGRLALALRTREDHAPAPPDPEPPRSNHPIGVLQGETWVPYNVP